ncbi:hypothetical protein BGZ54_008899 [Gamsiella multidivaricata]|nr:hypothetical protein BGZ54_008899 [Gamsiella multidivaricata]
MPATAAIMDTNTDSDNISTTQSSTARSNGGARGPLGPRPGVYRPCARCRVKKTKCDRSKPICSSCVKAGPDVICLYDNDELTEAYDSTSGAGLATAVLPMSTPATETKKGSDHQSKKATAAEGPHRGRKVVGVTAATTSAPRSSNGHTTRGGGDNSNNNTNGAKSVTAFSSQASSGGKRSGDVPPPSKKLKTGAGSSDTIKPSPLRSSVTSIRISTAKLLTFDSKETESALDENVDIESVDAVEDKDVSQLSIAEAIMDQVHSEANMDDTPESANVSIGKRTSSSNPGNAARQKKQHKGTSAATPSGSGGGNSARIMADPPVTKPSSAFAINKNQKARKWTRSGTVVQTLGGEISIPLWTSDQEMLLNEPRPYFIQRSYPMPTSSSIPSSTSATATSLARMAVLNQMDTSYGFDTPERGTTPESRENSPVPPSSPLMKKKTKRTFRKQGPADSPGAPAAYDDNMDPGGITASSPAPSITPSEAKRKRVGHGSSIGGGSNVGVGGDDDAGDSSARSTPAPTPRPRPIPTRPRMYPCSFEGCGKSFMDKFHLKRHETRHVTQMIVCGIDGCTKAYDSISTMRRHQSMVHKERKEEIARAAAAASGGHGGNRVDYAGSETMGHDRTIAGDESGGEGDDGESDDSEASPAPSSVTYTAVSSPMRD